MRTIQPDAGYRDQCGGQLRSRVPRDITMRARQPVRQAAERFVGGGIVERHQRGRAAVGVEDLCAPAVRGELQHLDPIIATIDLLNDTLGSRSQGRYTLTKTKSYSSLPPQRYKRRETRSPIHTREREQRAGKSPPDIFSRRGAPQAIHHPSTCFPQTAVAASLQWTEA